MKPTLSPSWELSTEHAASRHGQPVLVNRRAKPSGRGTSSRCPRVTATRWRRTASGGWRRRPT